MLIFSNIIYHNRKLIEMSKIHKHSGKEIGKYCISSPELLLNQSVIVISQVLAPQHPEKPHAGYKVLFAQ